MARALLSVVAFDLTDATSEIVHVLPGAAVTVYETNGTTLLVASMYAAATGGVAIANPLTANTLGVATAYTDVAQNCVVKIGTVSYPMQFIANQSDILSIPTPINLTRQAPGTVAAPAATLDSIYPLTDGTYAHRATGGTEKVFVDTSTAQTLAGPKALTAPAITNGTATGTTLVNTIVSGTIALPQVSGGVPSAAAPSLNHAGDPDTGMWFPADGQIAWSTDAVEAARLRAGALEAKVRDKGGVVFELDAFAADGTIINTGSQTAGNLASLDAAWSAVNALIVANGGGTVQLGPGTYMQTFTAHVANTIIRGAGIGATVIKRRDASGNRPTVDFYGYGLTVGVSNCTVTNLTVDGNRSANLTLDTTVSEIAMDEHYDAVGLGTTGGVNQTAFQVEVRNFGAHGISCGGDRNSVVNCHIFAGPSYSSPNIWPYNAPSTTCGGGYYGVFTPDNTICKNIFVHGNRIHGLRMPGIFVGGIGGIISANMVYDCHRALDAFGSDGGALALAPTSFNRTVNGNQAAKVWSIVGNTIGPPEDSAAAGKHCGGIELGVTPVGSLGVQTVVCAGNSIRGVKFGYSAISAIGLAIIGGSVSDITNTTANGTAIDIGANSAYFTAVGVSIRSCEIGISTTGTSDYFAVIGCLLTSNTVTNWVNTASGTNYESIGNVTLNNLGAVDVISNRMTSPLTVGTTSAAAAIRSLLTLGSVGTTRAGIGIDASNQLVLLNAALSTANLTMTDAGAATIRAGLTIAAGQTIIPIGSAATPSFAFSGTSSGLWSPGGEVIGFATSGVSSMYVTAAGLLDFRIAAAAVALGGGAAPTVGTIGGSGPAAAGQNSWLKVLIGGTASYIPIWR